MTQTELIGRNIRRLREDAKLDQGELADKIGVTRKAISAWETGRACPRMGAVEEMKKVFHCTINDIMNEPNSKLIEFAEALTQYEAHDHDPILQNILKIYNNYTPEKRSKLLDAAIDIMLN